MGGVVWSALLRYGIPISQLSSVVHLSENIFSIPVNYDPLLNKTQTFCKNVATKL